ncbi:hypothetical protein HH310_33805 [Actinoplanes sp. TBRC 11911]|uniref:hypothetical protein n=1 Tax=Actinoplanes sp. TBRC 11911 TaxID=2729386 RepID=UPI00145DDAA9|nr:hypothetical protein [Actinoplanes sp. TBRC 11911]NMO56142.1 hypothetical protein [Actinoplanes sp. TBRC 11911]
MTETARRPALRLVVMLLFVSVGMSLLVAALTLVFRHDILSYQLAHRPGADPGALERTLWTRPIPTFVVAILYIGVARRLREGGRRACRRVRIVSVVGLLAVGWLLVSGEYPGWLRIVQGVQMVALATLAIAVNRRSVRGELAASVPDARPRNRRAAWTLVVLSPVIAEVSLGNVPLRQAWIVVFFVPIYGAGTLLIREVVRRTGGSVVNLLVLGVAYGLVEEGLALQSLTSPRLYGAADWAPRLFGLNTAYTEVNLVYHAVFSVAVPVLLVELMFAGHGERAYVRRGGLVTTGIVALLGAGLLRVLVPPSEDPGYQMPVAAIVVIGLVTLVVAVVGIRLRVPAPTRQNGRPPAAIGLITGLATLLFLGLIWPFGGATQPSFTHGAWALLPMAVAAAVVVTTAMTLRRWSWTPSHLLGACLGAVAGHTVFGLVVNAETVEDRIFLGVLAAVTVAIAWRARPSGAVGWRRTAGGPPVKPEPAAAGGQERCSRSPSVPGRS